MTIDTLIIDAFEQWLAGEVDPTLVRRIEGGESSRQLWESLIESGFADLLLPEAEGGAQASLPTLFRFVFACGACSLPLPLPTTLWVRAVLRRNGLAIPDGPIALASGHRDGERILCAAVPFAATAEWVLADLGDEALLLPLAHAEVQAPGIYGSLRRDLSWPSEPQGAVRVPGRQDWQSVGAALTAALIAGASSCVLNMTLEYANNRTQFGKAIGRYQANQQQISVMAEEVFAARMAADLAWQGTSVPPRARAALAKVRASEAAMLIAGIAHAVFGAIGITEECDLQMFTRRLHEWRGDFGSAAFWQQEIGRELLANGDDMLAFVLAHTPGN